MRKTQPPSDALLRKLAEADRRSPLLRWLSEHYEALASALDGRNVKWGVFSANLSEAGVVDANGKPPSKAAVRQAWYRVRRSKRGGAAAQASPAPQPGRPPPSRFSADWQPPLAAPVPNPPLAGGSGPSTPVPAGRSAEARLARLEAKLDRRHSQ